jgi:hypothetical protein
MPMFDLKRQLKIHDRILLRELLGREKSMRRIDWQAIPLNDIEPISIGWEEMPEDRKSHFQVILQDVQQLSDRRGQKVLIEELEWRHPGQLEKFRKLKSAADKSLWAFLFATDAFDSAAIFARAEALRNGQQANIWNSLPKEPIVTTPEKISCLEHEVRSYYWIREMRGQVCQIHHYQRHDGVQYFFAYLPDWPDKRLYFDEHEKLTPRENTYAFHNVFVFEPKLGTIELIAKGGKKVQLPLRRAFCKSMLGIEVDDEEPVKSAYQLDHLLDSGFSFTTEPSEKIAEVYLRKIRLVPKVRIPAIEQIELRFRDSLNLFHIRSTVARQLSACGLGIDQVSITQASIQFLFMSDGTGRGRKMTVNVNCPNSSDLKAKPDQQQIVGRDCFLRWGIIND